MKQREKKQKSREVTIGFDLGDRRHRFCVLDGAEKQVDSKSRNVKLESRKLKAKLALASAAPCALFTLGG